MSMPGFTSEASCYRSRNYYSTIRRFDRSGLVVPVLIAGDGTTPLTPKLDCIGKCADPELRGKAGHCPVGMSNAACQTFCVNRCNSTGMDAGPSGPNLVNCVACEIGCFGWQYACKEELNALGLGFLSGYVCSSSICDCTATCN